MRKYIYLVCLLFLFFALSINVYAIEYVNNVFMISLAGKENILNAYKIAVNEKYRFFSFGDAMFIK